MKCHSPSHPPLLVLPKRTHCSVKNLLYFNFRRLQQTICIIKSFAGVWETIRYKEHTSKWCIPLWHIYWYEWWSSANFFFFLIGHIATKHLRSSPLIYMFNFVLTTSLNSHVWTGKSVFERYYTLLILVGYKVLANISRGLCLDFGQDGVLVKWMQMDLTR